MINPLLKLWHSTASLYARFGIRPNLNNTLMVFEEEAKELEYAAQNETAEQVAGEAVDVIVTVLGVCMASGLTLERIEKAVLATIRKNNAKTHQTHAVNEAGKIARIK